MPAMPREMSWLSPKRRRTTGNLRTLPNGDATTTESNAVAPAPKSPTPERPPSTHRPISQPIVGTAVSANTVSDGNLFYAYARKDDDLQSRYLLTFASAPIANEWWLLAQTHFPDVTRPGPQLFSFKTDGLLEKAWKHPSFAHLKSKWMYISFQDTEKGGGLGGAAQGIIPVQDAEGNLLGGTTGGAGSVASGEVKREARAVRDDVHRLEEYFEKMMEAVQKNTATIAELAGSQRPGSAGSSQSANTTPVINGTAESAKFSDLSVLTSHFKRMNELLTKNSQHVQDLAKKHYDNEQKLRQTMEGLASKQHNDYLDMQQLSSHLDRIQSMMETSIKERKDSAREVAEQQVRPTQIDFSPLTQRLEKVQEAVEKNSELVKALLDESKDDAGNQAPQVDLSPLKDHFDRLHKATEQQSEHMRALVGFASASGETEGADAGAQSGSLAPLGEHLEQIYNAIEEGNKHAKEAKPDLTLLTKHLKALREQSEKGNGHMERLLELQNAHGEKSTGHLERLLELQNAHSEKSAGHLERLLESQDATRGAVEANGGELDFTPLADLLEGIKESTDANTEAVKDLVEISKERYTPSVDVSPLTTRLDTLNESTEKNAERMLDLMESRQESSGIDFTPLTDRLNRIHSTLERQASSSERNTPGTGDSKFIMNALTSHLSKIQDVTEKNAQHVKNLREKQSSSQDKMHIAVSETSEQVRSLVRRNEENEARIDAQNSQMRELMSGQREMVEVMRQLTKSIVAQNKGACDHIVVPPPRKMGRKVVGFVYDAKEGPV